MARLEQSGLHSLCSPTKLEGKTQSELRLDLAAGVQGFWRLGSWGFFCSWGLRDGIGSTGVLLPDLLRLCTRMELKTEMRSEWLRLGVFRNWSFGVF
ncbi:Hypothetical predicted protein [Prunus dulcis]|uniref:Uncharacterized protein n=1 Tax=Prunus dulcis TaxID=3755 RepID=A0A5E4G3U5_PRUDU|nr:Hypothetical predicted protein [Prunus dulcis]